MPILNNFLSDILHERFESIDDLKNKYPSFKIVKIKKGEVIISKGDKAINSYILISGSCDISNEFDFSELNIIDTQSAPNVVGYYEELSNYPVYTSYVFAYTDCYVYEINSHDLDKIFRTDAKLCYTIMKQMHKVSEAVQIRNEQYHLFSGEDILGYHLYNLSKDSIPFVLENSREELAKILYLNLRTLYRHIDKLKKKDYLTIYKRKIIINEDNFKKLDKRYHNVIL